MHIIRSFFIAIANYSAIPVPNFEWREEDMRYTLCFFPVVGIVIGILEWLWFRFCMAEDIGAVARTLIGVALPVLITGGFHIDGYMDTMDALSSHQTPERKRQILKDSHIGAFAVIRVIFYFLLYAAAFSEIQTGRQMMVVSIGFALTRTLSGLAALHFPMSNGKGTMAGMADASAKKVSTIVLFAEMAVCILAMVLIDPLPGAAAAISAEAMLIYYYYMSRKEFGGVSGDLAGYFVTAAELAIAMAVAIMRIAFRL